MTTYFGDAATITFPWVTATVGMVVVLGTTRLLMSALAVFRARHQVRMDWIPFAWAGFILVALFDFTWATQSLGATVKDWTPMLYLSLVILGLLLFVAAALVLPNVAPPSGSDLRASFQSDGRWSLAFLAGFEVISALVAWYLLDVSPSTGRGVTTGVLIALLLMYLSAARSRKAEAGITILFAIATFISVVRIGNW